jgi:HSP20 family protein
MRRLSVWGPWGMMPRDFDWDGMDVDYSDIQMDVYEEGDNVMVKVKAPGFKKDEIDVSVESGTITVVGKSQESMEEDNKRRKYYRKEISKKSFTRSCALPVEVEPSKSEAKFEDGVLVVTLPKSERAKPKKIDIDVK